MKTIGMNQRKILDELENLSSSLMPYPNELNQKYWEGYRNALCRVMGEDKSTYPFKWE